MPIEYPGRRGRRASTRPCASGSASSTSATSARPRSRARARRTSSTPASTNDLGRIQPARRSTRCAATSPAASSTTSSPTCAADDDVFLIPNAANTAEVVRRCSQAAAPDGIEVTEPARELRRHRRAGHQERRGARGARPADRPRLHVVRRGRLAGAPGHRLPHRLHRGARLRARARAGRTRRPCGTRSSRRPRRTAACPAAWARATRCAPRWATRCTATTSALDITPVQARAGWAVGWKKDALLGQGGAGRREGRRARRASWGLLATGRGIPRAHCAGEVRRRRGGRRGHLRHVLADAEAGHRPGPARPDRAPRATRSSSTCAGARCRRRWSSRRSCRSRRPPGLTPPGMPGAHPSGPSRLSGVGPSVVPCATDSSSPSPTPASSPSSRRWGSSTGGTGSSPGRRSSASTPG